MKKNLRGIKVIYDKQVVITRERDPEIEWSGEDTITSYNIKGICLEESNDYGDLSIDFTPERGVDYYLLYVIYSTADSFNRHENGEIEFIDLYRSMDPAKHNLERIQESQKGHHLFLVKEAGKKYKVHKPWDGYFERLQEVSIESVCIRVPKISWKP